MRPTLNVARILAFAASISFVLCAGSLVHADGFGLKSGVQVTASITPAKAKPGQTVTFAVRLKLPVGYHTYPQKTKAGLPTKISVRNTTGLDAIDKSFTPTTKPKKVLDPDTGDMYDVFEKTVTWTRKFRVQKTAKTADIAGAIRIKFVPTTSANHRRPSK